MWSDTLLALEIDHLTRLFIWSGGSIVVGAAVLTVFWRRRVELPLIWHFGAQTATWGLGELVFALARWYLVGLRDIDSAARLDHQVWFALGLEGGLVALAGAAATFVWFTSGGARRLAWVGVAFGVSIQCVALLVLDLQLVLAISI